MKISLKMAALLMALMFAVQGCALFIGDHDGFRHRHFRHRGHSSLEQLSQPTTGDLLAKNEIDHRQMDKGSAD